MADLKISLLFNNKLTFNIMEKKKYLCIEFHDKNGNIDPNLSKCPANPEQVMAALQFLSDGCDYVVSIQDEPIDFFKISEE